MVPIRTEEDIIARAPIKVTLGEAEYGIKPLPILKARAWRKMLIEEVKSVTESMKVDSSNNNAFFGALGFIFLQFPEKIADLVFSYAPDLPQAKVLAEATEEQLASAFGQIVQVAFPFTGELKTISQTLGIAGSFPQLAKFTR